MPDPNESMINKLHGHVIGKKVEDVSVTGHKVTIRMESGASCVLEFEDIVDFALHGPGRWVFVPTKNGRPKKGALPAQPDQTEKKEPK